MTALRATGALLSVVLMLASLTLTTAAQDTKIQPSHIAVAKEFLRVIRVDRSMDQMMALLLPLKMKRLRKLRPEVPQKVIDRYGELFSDAVSRHRDDFINAAALIYAGHLNETDLTNAIVFYSTESGRNLVNAQHVMTSKVARLIEPMAKQLSNEASAEALRQLKKEGHDL